MAPGLQGIGWWLNKKVVDPFIDILTSLVIVFLRFGEFLMGGPHFPLTSDALRKVLTGQASMEIFLSIVHALLGWLVMAPFIMGLLYIILVPCFTILVRKFSSTVSSPKRDDAPSYVELTFKERDV
ncbi:uncharacterized protein LOC143625730 isoform X1 [Bidens hawaiensis]|uniref:uncharacterized protein LOC143625730 isoform X1 n=1 Tax=Bidens hawaiensis TaxID=980011 RepID=UPI00404A382F